MTAEAARAFAERLKTDEVFRTKLAEASDPAERLRLVKEEGFDLKVDDVGAVKEALGIEELSDADLERVAGGAGATTVGTIAGGYTVTLATAVAAAVF